MLLAEEGRATGTYLRKTYKTDTIYTFYSYKEVKAVYNMRTGRVNLSDGLAERLLQNGFITAAVKHQYDCQLAELFEPVERYDDAFIETVYEAICKLRASVFGRNVLKEEEELRAVGQCSFDPTGGIDQRGKKDQLLRDKELLLFVCTQSELQWLMEQDIKKARKSGKQVGTFICSEAEGQSLNLEKEILFQFSELWEKERAQERQQLLDQNKAGILFYGEEGLLHCRRLRAEAIVHGIPSWYHTRALTNQFGIEKACVVYVPAGFDLTEWVPLTERSRLTYWHLTKLWEKYGDEIYTCSLPRLYRSYPQYFLNIYEHGATCCEADAEYPIQVKWEDGLAESGDEKTLFTVYDRLREQAVSDYLKNYERLEYESAYFDELLCRCDIDWSSTEQLPGILVQAVSVSKVTDAQVVNCEVYSTVRQMADATKKDLVGLRLYSNFLFFLTPKLARMYNELRIDRPREQISFDKIHLDYMLYEKEGKRVETFPLFRKACIAMKENGQFLFCRFGLGGGYLSVGNFAVNWRAEDVNSEGDGPIHIHTPYQSAGESETDVKDYRLLVGEGRVNIVIVQEQVICVRKGSVVLPSIGVVVSLSCEMGQEFLRSNSAAMLEDGYYDCSHLELRIKLDAPFGVQEEEWKQVKWAYGGGMSLITDGRGLFDGGDMADMLDTLAKEGWMSPLSCQTQESALHELVKHPRTAIGMTEDGKLVILVYSGRTRMSAGADYREMIIIARKLFPGIWNLMNVDGGGSAMLGMAIGGSFMELSYPATSIESCAGMARPVNTVLCLEIDEDERKRSTSHD